MASIGTYRLHERGFRMRPIFLFSIDGAQVADGVSELEPVAGNVWLACSTTMLVPHEYLTTRA